MVTVIAGPFPAHAAPSNDRPRTGKYNIAAPLFLSKNDQTDI
jgi:hypothetical protein